MIVGFVVMVITGALLFYAIPVRSYQSIWFRGKVVALILAGLERVRLPRRHRSPRRRVGSRAGAAAGARAGPAPPRSCCGPIIVVAGRMIAYNWFDCDKQPQSHVVNVVAGCVVPPAGGGR